MFQFEREPWEGVIEAKGIDCLGPARRMAGANAGNSAIRAADAVSGRYRPAAAHGWRDRPARAATIVVYHDLSSEASKLTANLGVSTDPDVFLKHVRYLARNYDLVEPADLLGQRLPRKPLLITFDDVYRSILDLAGPILRELNAPSIWFLNPAAIEEEMLPLDNLISWAVSEIGLHEVARLLGEEGRVASRVCDLISRCIATRTYDQVAAFRARLESKLPHCSREARRNSNLFLNSIDLARLPSYGMRVGNHTKTHSFLRALSRAELDTEIRTSRESLQRMSGQSVSQFAIPYGNERDLTMAVLDAARASGHTGIYLVHARHNAMRPARDIFYRIDPGNVAPRYLAYDA